jgi:tetratricopeptide (TPR) repeat protein
MWTEAYQTVLTGMFEVQSKVAKQVASTLNITLLAPERSYLAAKLTDSREAYSQYFKARQILDTSNRTGSIRRAATMLEKATSIDPEFVVAWAYLAIAHTELYWNGGDPTPDRLRLARKALSRGTEVNPDVPEIHLAHGVLLYHGERNYDDALKEFQATRSLRPSDPDVPLYEGAILERQGRADDAIEAFKRALELDPRSAGTLVNLANTYLFVRRYREAESSIAEAMLLSPTEPDGPRIRMLIALHARGNVPEAIEHLRNAVTTVQPASSLTRLLLENPWPAVEDPALRKILLTSPYSPDLGRGFFYSSKATVMMYLGDRVQARSYADSAIGAIPYEMRYVAEQSSLHLYLAVAHSILGNRREALDELTRADDALPLSLDAFRYADRENTRVLILTNLGDYDAAIGQMEKRLDAPGGLSRDYFRLNPLFAPMRANTRFQRVIQAR